MNKEIEWIPVDISNGMFSNEYSVVLKDLKEKLSLYVDKSLVKEDEKGAFLKVYVIREDSGRNKKVVLLPSEAFETSSRWVEVKSEV